MKPNYWILRSFGDKIRVLYIIPGIIDTEHVFTDDGLESPGHSTMFYTFTPPLWEVFS